MTPRFEPAIIGFLCNWCSYTGADLAGISRLQYPPNLRPIRVMCSGMVHPDLVLEAFSQGADGVLILGCHPGECHYLEGNTKASLRANIISIVLEDINIDPERFDLKWISSAEASVFAELVTNFTLKIQKLGPYKKDKKIRMGNVDI